MSKNAARRVRRGSKRSRVSRRASRVFTVGSTVVVFAMVLSLVWLTPTKAQTSTEPASSIEPLIEAMAAQPLQPTTALAEPLVEAAASILPGGMAGDELEYDACGNLTYDGVFKYTYDAWNRQVQVIKAYRDENHNLQLGSVVQEKEYDGLNRLTVVRTINSGDLNGTEHFYYDGWSEVETRNGSGITTRQTVTAGRAGGYIDEVVQVAHNLDWPPNLPEADNTAEAKFWAMGDANYNVVGVVDAGGRLVERYEYTPYGQRTVYASAGASDSRCLTPTPKVMSQGVVMSNAISTQHDLNPWGHQGLKHDKASSLIYNRLRYRMPEHGTFNQREPLGYVDGMNLYSQMAGEPIGWLDPLGDRRAHYPVMNAADHNAWAAGRYGGFGGGGCATAGAKFGGSHGGGAIGGSRSSPYPRASSPPMLRVHPRPPSPLPAPPAPRPAPPVQRHIFPPQVAVPGVIEDGQVLPDYCNSTSNPVDLCNSAQYSPRRRSTPQPTPNYPEDHPNFRDNKRCAQRCDADYTIEYDWCDRLSPELRTQCHNSILHQYSQCIRDCNRQYPLR